MKNTKFEYGDIVNFKINGAIKTGRVYIIDANGTFENPGVASYDIMVDDENTLYKHIEECKLKAHLDQ